MDTNALEEAQMLAQAKSEVIESGSYLAAGDIAGCSIDQLEQWKRDRRIFAIDHAGADLFPAYAIDPQHEWNPYPAVAAVMSIFDGKIGPWGSAFWFEGVNGYLDGRAPKDVLATDPGRVIKAAELEVQTVSHA